MSPTNRTQTSVSPKDRETLDIFVKRVLEIPGMPDVTVEELAKRPADYFNIAAKGCQKAIETEGIHMSGPALGIYAAWRNYAENMAKEAKRYH
jgi:hypothetical protein